MPEGADRYHCAQRGCKGTAPKHQWSEKTKAGKGWFHQKDGTSWCPDHHPEWVKEWRERRGQA